MEELYEKYKDVIAYVGVNNEGQLYLDFDEAKVSVEDLIVLLNQITTEYLKAISPKQENADGKEKRTSRRK